MLKLCILSTQVFKQFLKYVLGGVSFEEQYFQVHTSLLDGLQQAVDLMTSFFHCCLG